MSDDSFDLSQIDEIENVWIPARDGTRLAARLWLPRGAEAAPVPAILEYIPYRKRDFMRQRDEPMHRYFALSGYASVRVDLRGSGDSEGVLTDEYLPQEQEDAVDIIAWIAAQPWCDGSVGMTGISWGGFNALQVAAHAPPALKAVISLCASDDRYADDAHYKGGCLLNENLQWGSIFTLYNALPPDPEIVGEAWRKMWQTRLDALEPLPPRWMRHPLRDGYWRQGSVAENFGAVRIPVYAIGGWADGYTNATFRLLAGLTCPRKGLVGPWAHMYPHRGVPGPAIGYLQEAVRWWDHWLKGRDTGIMDEPMLRAWIQGPVRPAPQYAERPGRWVAERLWPSPRVGPLTLYLDRARLCPGPGPEGTPGVASPETLGGRGGEWCGFGADGEAPRDQRPDDGGSLVFDSDPFEADTDFLGAPVLEAEVMADRPAVHLVARLCDVAPDGASLRVSYGMLNLGHEAGHAAARPLEPGRWHPMRLKLDDFGHRVPAGHRLRLALSTAYWPMIWPAPAPAFLTVRTGLASLTLPERPSCDDDGRLVPFAPPRAAPGPTARRLMPLGFKRKVEIDLTTGEMVQTMSGDGGEFGGAALARLDDIDLELSYRQSRRYRIVEGDPLSARAEYRQAATLKRGDWDVCVELDTSLTSTASVFRFTARLRASDGERVAASRDWDIEVPRGPL